MSSAALGVKERLVGGVEKWYDDALGTNFLDHGRAIIRGYRYERARLDGGAMTFWSGSACSFQISRASYLFLL